MWPINQYLLVEYPSRHIRGHIKPKRRVSETLPGQNELLSPLVWSTPYITQLAHIFSWKMHNSPLRASSRDPEEAFQGMPRHHETNRVGYRADWYTPSEKDGNHPPLRQFWTGLGKTPSYFLGVEKGLELHSYFATCGLCNVGNNVLSDTKGICDWLVITFFNALILQCGS